MADREYVSIVLRQFGDVSRTRGEDFERTCRSRRCWGVLAHRLPTTDVRAQQRAGGALTGNRDGSTLSVSERNRMLL